MSNSKLTPIKIAVAIVALIAIGVIVSVFVRTSSDEPTPPSNQNTNQSNGGGTITEATPGELTLIDGPSILAFLNEGQSGFLYVGRPTCPFCQVFEPMLAEVAAEKNLQVFYYNTEDNSGNAEGWEAMTILEVVYVPHFIFISNGQLADALEDTTSREALVEFINKHR
ncbi:thioredoxin family protein [Candidatus Saccharibacteria bacterium]|nr:thioredoxin family protein [Candidatus Saccharibacteria bacterium]